MLLDDNVRSIKGKVHRSLITEIESAPELHSKCHFSMKLPIEDKVSLQYS